MEDIEKLTDTNIIIAIDSTACVVIFLLMQTDFFIYTCIFLHSLTISLLVRKDPISKSKLYIISLFMTIVCLLNYVITLLFLKYTLFSLIKGCNDFFLLLESISVLSCVIKVVQNTPTPTPTPISTPVVLTQTTPSSSVPPLHTIVIDMDNNVQYAKNTEIN